MQQFDAIFEIFSWAVFEAIEVKGRSMLNFEVTTSKFCNNFWKFGRNLKKVRQAGVWERISKFWFYWLWELSFRITYKSKLWGTTCKKTNFLKKASNQCKSSRYYWEVWILGRGHQKKILSSEEWCVSPGWNTSQKLNRMRVKTGMRIPNNVS